MLRKLLGSLASNLRFSDLTLPIRSIKIAKNLTTLIIITYGKISSSLKYNSRFEVGIAFKPQLTFSFWFERLWPLLRAKKPWKPQKSQVKCRKIARKINMNTSFILEHSWYFYLKEIKKRKNKSRFDRHDGFADFHFHFIPYYLFYTSVLIFLKTNKCSNYLWFNGVFKKFEFT